MMMSALGKKNHLLQQSPSLIFDMVQGIVLSQLSDDESICTLAKKSVTVISSQRTSSEKCEKGNEYWSDLLRGSSFEFTHNNGLNKYIPSSNHLFLILIRVFDHFVFVDLVPLFVDARLQFRHRWKLSCGLSVLQGSFLVLDDLMDYSVTDSHSLVGSDSQRGIPCYVDLVDMFNEVQFQTACGRIINLISSFRWRKIFCPSTPSYVKNVLVDMGIYFQVQRSTIRPHMPGFFLRSNCS
ncbi:hypothetical protein CARUB_v10002411mg [Capsella rubella]|uniref:Uncharacterized protein n=1 Tax=Capsella rubella TaxID=81985 RepID=R0GYF2_9BRAS|nr:hypothetical protein CARUB_v10002411mg [Capsella rubella]